MFISRMVEFWKGAGSASFMKRIGYIGIIVSYIILACTAIFCIFVSPLNIGIVPKILIVLGLGLLFFSLLLIEKNTTKEDLVVTENRKLDLWLKAIAYLPVIVILGIPLIIISSVVTLIVHVRNNFKKQTKPLKMAGFKRETRKQGKNRRYLFIKGNCVVKIIPNESYEISVDGGTSFINIVDTDMGTYEERQHLAYLLKAYKTCDYRDKDIYEPTAAVVALIVKYT